MLSFQDRTQRWIDIAEFSTSNVGLHRFSRDNCRCSCSSVYHSLRDEVCDSRSDRQIFRAKSGQCCEIYILVNREVPVLVAIIVIEVVSVWVDVLNMVAVVVVSTPEIMPVLFIKLMVSVTVLSEKSSAHDGSKSWLG